MLGRVTATMRFVVMGTSPFGALAGGALGTWLGLRNALWVVLSILTLAGTPLLNRTFTYQRDLPTTPAQPEASNSDTPPTQPESLHSQSNTPRQYKPPGKTPHAERYYSLPREQESSANSS